MIEFLYTVIKRFAFKQIAVRLRIIVSNEAVLREVTCVHYLGATTSNYSHLFRYDIDMSVDWLRISGMVFGSSILLFFP
jgi:hypothetical protein